MTDIKSIKADELEDTALITYPVKHKFNKKGTGEYDSNLPRRKAFIAGANWQKEQMMKCAVKGCVSTRYNDMLRATTRLMDIEIQNKLGIKFGDNVKLIIIKED